ncbi:DUF1080 domain-containing protein [Luteolibacter ambystomatis]|uniref:DUF1080 domain-containing protein n=1 Tax=Luteolibacter ambystomatis TaxID=2824561 RepID=A0A975PGM9_9BACT|nr:PVC-type heme-binding CxxCH protein [Luteolibacter ambystomatis]QUE52421.1 DUF1080 domain-containing protein [Luteolibacter ambystomatis]
MKTIHVLAFGLSLAGAAHAAPVSIFDGKTLQGWEMPKGEEKWWRVQDGAITGGSLEEKTTTNLFLSTAKEYGNFEMKFRIRLIKGEGFINSGMQVRSIREPGQSRMRGYQVDAGIGYWGDLYDEARRDVKLSAALDPQALKAAVKDWEWNDYRIVCEGRRIRSWINGVPALDYTEREGKIPLDGLIGIQVHSGGKCLVQCKDFTLDELPDTPGVPTWKATQVDPPAPVAAGSSALSAADQLKKFHLPEGFTAELVASEEQGVGKPITVAWDGRGRMWTMTAFEYPVDGNENKASADALYAKAGKDKVLVFDDPSAPLPLTPRVFTDGLAIPLGLMPDLDGNGALVHHGSQIRHYVDSNGDGKADKFDVVLDGFGVQDSHLMPHQFERAPGGWVYVAQGLFNASKVRRPDGKPFPDGSLEKSFNACKLGRFRADGSDFEAVTAGPNNIWGLVQTRSGETFVQEANDMGMPLSEFEPGAHYRGGSREKLKAYAPYIPESTPGVQMGGTGLSGLAVAGDEGSRFATLYGGQDVVYVANPITNRIQVVSMNRDGADRHPEYYKRRDFLVSDDPWFRPVSVKFGPDGFLYITDWYNKIISHNEVPRNHPDRDKTRGRIWRIRPTDAKPVKPVNVAEMNADQLVAQLGGPGALDAAMAWQRLVETKPAAVKEKLIALAVDPKAKLARRLDALHALDAYGVPAVEVFKKLAIDPQASIRHEALRIAGEKGLAANDFVTVFANAATDPNYRVRAALANAVRHHPDVTPAMVALVARLGREPLGGPVWDAYDRQFERYLARWVMELHPEETRRMLASGNGLAPEARLLAILSLPPAQAAPLLVAELSNIKRPLDAEELALLGSQIDQPEVVSALDRLLADPAKRAPLLQGLTRLEPAMLTKPALATVVTKACRAILQAQPKPEDRALVLQLARLLRLRDLEPEIASWLDRDKPSAELVAILSALRETGSTRADAFAGFLDHADEAVRRAAVGALSGADDPKAVTLLAEKWSGLPGALRTIAIDGLTSTKAKAAAFAEAAAAGKFGELDGSAFERLILVMGDQEPSVAKLLAKSGTQLARVIHLNGNAGQIDRTVDLEGPFTVETWIRLAPGIDNRDGLLGALNGPGMNFHDARLRVFAGSDVAIANRRVEPNLWTHCAVTRDTEGRVKIYLDGELDQDKGKPLTEPLKGLRIGGTTTTATSGADYYEFRIWNTARSADEIRANYQTDMAGMKSPGLVLRLSGDDPGKLVPPAVVQLTRDFPVLMTAQQAAEKAAKFGKYKDIVSRKGDPVAGRATFQNTCMICHQARGEGTQIGPDLSGIGAMGLEGVLRNVLDPNAQLESGYYRHDLTLTDGTVISGFLVQDTADAVTIRPIGAEPRVVERKKIASHVISKRSLMPEGLLDGMDEQKAADLFNYLMTLK